MGFSIAIFDDRVNHQFNLCSSLDCHRLKKTHLEMHPNVAGDLNNYRFVHHGFAATYMSPSVMLDTRHAFCIFVLVNILKLMVNKINKQRIPWICFRGPPKLEHPPSIDRGCAGSEIPSCLVMVTWRHEIRIKATMIPIISSMTTRKYHQI